MAQAGELLSSLQARRPPAHLKIAGGAAYDDHLKKLAADLSRTEPITLSSQGCLEQLDPYEDTLPNIYVLAALTGGWEKPLSVTASELPRPGSDIWKYLVRGLLKLNPEQARYAGRLWTLLVLRLSSSNKLAPISKAESCTALAVKALLRLDPSAGTLTTTHIKILEGCLTAQAYEQALELVEAPIHSLAAQSSPSDQMLCDVDAASSSGTWMTEGNGFSEPLAVTDVQQYFLMSGMIFIGLRRWVEAARSLELVLCVPCREGSSNLPMVEAYRKWVLVSLLAQGSVPSTMRSVNQTSMKSVRALSKGYEAITEAFRLSDPSRLVAEVTEASDMFKKEANFGLVRHVLQEHRKIQIRNLQSVYTAIPISRVASNFAISAEEAETYVRGLINEGSLMATLDYDALRPELGIVLRFNKGHSESEQEMEKKLMIAKSKIEKLNQYLLDANGRLALTKEFVEHTRKARRDRLRESIGDADAPDATLGGPPSDDEQLMTDT